MRRFPLIAVLMAALLPGAAQSAAAVGQGPNCYSDGTCMTPPEPRPFPQRDPGVVERAPPEDRRQPRPPPRQMIAPTPIQPLVTIPEPPAPPQAPSLPRNYELRTEASGLVSLRNAQGEISQGVRQGSLTTIRDGDNTIQTRIEPNGGVTVNSTNGASARGVIDGNGILVLHGSDGSVTTCMPVGNTTRCN